MNVNVKSKAAPPPPPTAPTILYSRASNNIEGDEANAMRRKRMKIYTTNTWTVVVVLN